MIPATPARPHAWIGPAALDLPVAEAVAPPEEVEPPDEPDEVAVEAAVEPAADEPAAVDADPDEADPDEAGTEEEPDGEEEPKASAEPTIPPWTLLGAELPLVEPAALL